MACSPRKDQEFENEAALRKAVEETATFLTGRKLKNVFVDLIHEYNHERIDMEIFREADPMVQAACPRHRSGRLPDYRAAFRPTT